MLTMDRRQRRGLTEHEPPEIDRVQPVRVLGRIHQLQDPPRIQPAGQRQLNDVAGAGRVRVQLGDLLPLIAMAKRHNYLWLRDFLDDEVRISKDLYEVLRAFRCYRPSA